MRKYNIFKIILPTISCIKNRGKLPKINIFPLYIIKFFFRHRFSFLKVFTITFSLYEHGIKRWNVFFFFILLPLKLKLFFSSNISYYENHFSSCLFSTPKMPNRNRTIMYKCYSTLIRLLPECVESVSNFSLYINSDRWIDGKFRWEIQINRPFR